MALVHMEMRKLTLLATHAVMGLEIEARPFSQATKEEDTMQHLLVAWLALSHVTLRLRLQQLPRRFVVSQHRRTVAFDELFRRQLGNSFCRIRQSACDDVILKWGFLDAFSPRSVLAHMLTFQSWSLAEKEPTIRQCIAYVQATIPVCELVRSCADFPTGAGPHLRVLPTHAMLSLPLPLARAKRDAFRHLSPSEGNYPSYDLRGEAAQHPVFDRTTAAYL